MLGVPKLMPEHLESLGRGRRAAMANTTFLAVIAARLPPSTDSKCLVMTDSNVQSEL